MHRPESSNPTSFGSPSPTRRRSPLPIGAAILFLALATSAAPASAAGTQTTVVASLFVTLLSSDLTGVVLTFVLIAVGYLVAGTRSRRFRDRRPGKF